ncbi:MAG: DNA adenine methylase [Candidatus Magasanikbacteria bacterium]|nr:DNA adenine methylase [Candidatus Magasanikbacteria bacterium]
MRNRQFDIFGNKTFTVPKTQGIKYAGSKLKILPYIVQILSELDGIKNVLDGFSGTTRVSQTFAQLGYDTTSSDISVWSEIFGHCFLLSKKSDSFYQKIIDHLNSLNGCHGWYTEHYGAEIAEIKRPFQAKNTRKLDAIRDEIEKLNLDWTDKCVILASLIYALDSVDSTLGHYAAYLSKWSPRSYHDLFLKLPKRFETSGEHKVIHNDIFDTVLNNDFDLAYFDPPYGSNNEKMPPSRVRYASYYHIWTTIINHDKPEIFGKANRRVDSRDGVAASVFEEFRKNDDGSFIAMEALRKLIQTTNARYILLSYSSGGRATQQELNEIINESGKLIKAVEINYKKNVMANMRWTNEWINSDGKHHEYLFLMEKDVAPANQIQSKEFWASSVHHFSSLAPVSQKEKIKSGSF